MQSDSPTVPDFAGVRVLVVGDVMLDRYWVGESARISPEAPVPVVRVDSAETRPGGAANVAVNIAALGAYPLLVGLVGKDDEARELEALLASSGVEHELLPRAGYRTVTKLRVLSRHQQLIRLDTECVGSPSDVAVAPADLAPLLHSVHAVVFSDYGKGSLASVEPLIAQARNSGKPVLVDPKGRDFNRYRGATVVTPNLHEFEAVAGTCPDTDELESRAEALRGELELDALLITRGEDGMTLVEKGRAVWHLSTRSREVFDVTGAGDTVIAVCSAALATGLGLRQAVALSNAAAGLVVAKLGAATVTAAELRQALWGFDVPGRGVVSLTELMGAVTAARRAGERIVMTNGCFDLLHAGHVGYLNEARALGDRLIVAVNDDASVRRLKGSRRPLNALFDRMQVLAALRSVDWVVPFSDDTPEALIRQVLPDVLVKGGDYRKEQVAGAACVESNGGRVEILRYREGFSTSALIDAASRDGGAGRVAGGRDR